MKGPDDGCGAFSYPFARRAARLVRPDRRGRWCLDSQARHPELAWTLPRRQPPHRSP